MKRNLKLDNGSDVVVYIKEPVLDEATDGHYSCEFLISGLSRSVASVGMGVDAIDAIVNVLSLVGNRLYTSDEFKAGRLSWECSLADGDLGFPSTI